MDLTNYKVILDIIVSLTVISGIIIGISKKIRKKIADTLFKQIDSTSPACYASAAINLSHVNSENIEIIKSDIGVIKDNFENIQSTLHHIEDRLIDGDYSFNELQKSTIRLEILQMIHDVADIKQISELYDKYKSLGGNSYIDYIYKDYIDSLKK